MDLLQVIIGGLISGVPTAILVAVKAGKLIERLDTLRRDFTDHKKDPHAHRRQHQ